MPEKLSLSKLKKDLRSLGTTEKAKTSAWFFKTGPGQYGHGDVFLGVTVPEQRKIAKKFQSLSLDEVEKLLRSKEHEYRLTALLILVNQFEKGSEEQKKQIYDLYLKNTNYINNWDLVDTSACIVGRFLENRSKSILTKLAKSELIWERRIAIIATFTFIQKGEADTTLKIAEILLTDKHDLIQKAVGWMLREIGKRVSRESEVVFLDKHAKQMPRTALRYALEHFPTDLRKKYMQK